MAYREFTVVPGEIDEVVLDRQVRAASRCRRSIEPTSRDLALHDSRIVFDHVMNRQHAEMKASTVQPFRNREVLRNKSPVIHCGNVPPMNSVRETEMHDIAIQ